ncbi:DUF3892 domain-containing protein [Pararhizobium sp. LjRoot238]|uniref:DUF3892 domain-containing protein n=1 Tax=Pararhizobium sp. LjRoot238 TaxID=3342293 RepID=UPI003ECC4DC4
MVTKQRKVTGVRQDKDGDITHVLLDGNIRVTPLKNAVEMAERGELKDVHAVAGEKKKYLRSDPNGSAGDNLDNLRKV